MLSVVIQAGGASSRMGQDKAFIELAGLPLIVHVLEKISGLGDELIIVTNSPERFDSFGAVLVSDRIPGQGALQGLETALNSAKHNRVLHLASDMPFLSRSLLKHIVQLQPEVDIVIPVREGRFEPMHAVYNKRCLLSIREALQAGEKRMISFFHSVEVHSVNEQELHRYDPEGLSFFNVNTPKELKEAERIYASKILRKLED